MPLIGPQKTPHDFGFTQNDSHIVVNDEIERAKAFDFNGNLLWETNCLARGQGSDFDFKHYATDTPPGLYYLGDCWRDYLDGDGYTKDKRSYGWITYDMVELENQENKYGRAGICLHGGGSANGWPGAWLPRQRLVPTLGCIRFYNEDLLEKVLPLYNKGKVYVSVYQEG